MTLALEGQFVRRVVMLHGGEQLALLLQVVITLSLRVDMKELHLLALRFQLLGVVIVAKHRAA